MTRDRSFSIAALLVALVIALPAPSAAQRRNRDAGDNGETGSKAVPRGEAPAAEPARPAPPAPAPAPPPPPPAPPRAEAHGPEEGQATARRAPRIAEPNEARARPSAGARPRDGRPVTGTAVPRGSVPAPRPPEFVPVYHGYWPWGYGGLGFGSYYGYGAYYDPYVFYAPYGPWYDHGPQGVSGYADGALRLKVKPRDAQVFVDGYYVGVVDEFDGVFQRLHLEAGSHRIEIRAPGFETLTFDVQIRWDDTTTYEGLLRRLP